MKTLSSWAPAPNVTVLAVERAEPGWIVAVDSRDRPTCLDCGTSSSLRHSSYQRTLRVLPAQGAPVTIQARLTRWRCGNDRRDRRIFAERRPGLAAPFARRTARPPGIVRLFGHSTGGRPSERLMGRLGRSVSDTTILRSAKDRGAAQTNPAMVRVAGVTEWARRKGLNYGTIIVDLERREVVDLLADRSAATMADWFKEHPEIEVVSRDRAGLYADAVRQSATQARQIARTRGKVWWVYHPAWPVRAGLAQPGLKSDRVIYLEGGDGRSALRSLPRQLGQWHLRCLLPPIEKTLQYGIFRSRACHAQELLNLCIRYAASGCIGKLKLVDLMEELLRCAEQPRCVAAARVGEMHLTVRCRYANDLLVRQTSQ
jgi:Transposase